MDSHDVIAAVITPVGEGGIAVVRASGARAIDFAAASFRGSCPLTEAPTHTVHFGVFHDAEGRKIDDVLATVFRAPRSYTGENTVEISCHGGIFVSSKILDALLSGGARVAEPGEFTRRAFLNGKLDLAQAEAVADLIRAQSEYAHRLSIEQLNGRLSHDIEGLRSRVIDICALVELELDFAEEGLELASKKEFLSRIDAVMGEIEKMISSYAGGALCMEGVRVGLCGSPNVGKSSIFNSLLDKNRAIVTHLPGTTRDVLEERIIINGMMYRLFDTAGVRESRDVVEEEGIRRARRVLDDADIVLHVTSCDQMTSEEVDMGVDPRSVIEVVNKFDLVGFDEKVVRLPGALCVSAKSGYGINELRSKIAEISFGRFQGRSESATLTSRRHLECLERATDFLSNAYERLEESAGNELIAEELRGAIDALGMIVGAVTSDEILNAIFSKFCIGK